MAKRMADLNKRFLVSCVVLMILGALVVFSNQLWISFLIGLIVAIVAGIGVWEYAQLANAKGLQPATRFMIGIAVSVVCTYFLSLKNPGLAQLPMVVLALGIMLLFLRHFRDTQDALVHIAVEFFGICYIAVPLSLLIGILYPTVIAGVREDGRWWFAYLIVVTKITDMGAYFVGRLWGKHKLAPILSPKKTVEGAIAGFICAWLASILIALLGRKYSHGMFELNLLEATTLGMIIGVVGQIGDLAESLLKRDAVVKDSNRLPGLGGVLDMVDSLLLTGPTVYFFLTLH